MCKIMEQHSTKVHINMTWGDLFRTRRGIWKVLRNSAGEFHSARICDIWTAACNKALWICKFLKCLKARTQLFLAALFMRQRVLRYSWSVLLWHRTSQWDAWSPGIFLERLSFWRANWFPTAGYPKLRCTLRPRVQIQKNSKMFHAPNVESSAGLETMNLEIHRTWWRSMMNGTWWTYLFSVPNVVLSLQHRYMSGGQNYLLHLTTRNGHSQSGWSPIGCEGLYLHAICKNRVSVSGWSPVGCECVRTNLNIPCPLPATLVFR